jgi:hypothetical protein
MDDLLNSLIRKNKNQNSQPYPSVLFLAGFIFIPLVSRFLNETANASYFSGQQLALTFSASA